MLLVVADAHALVWLFLYAHWFLKLRLGESTLGQPGANDAPHAEVNGVRIEGDVMRRAARKGVRRVGWVLIFTLAAVVDWFPTKRPLSAWEMVLAGENALICLLLVILMTRLEKLRRLYRLSAQVHLAAAH
jgi:hypothetical protein